MSVNKISEAILGVGVDDTTIDLFESQYPVPTGVSYNSYVILDEKTAVLDTVDARATEPWLENLTEALAGRKPDYLVVSHMEPDHGANIAKLAALYPEMQVLLFFVIPIRVKYFGLFAGALWLLSFLGAGAAGKLNYLLCMANFLVFFGPQAWRSVRAWVRREQWKRKNRR